MILQTLKILGIAFSITALICAFFAIPMLHAEFWVWLLHVPLYRQLDVRFMVGLPTLVFEIVTIIVFRAYWEERSDG